MIFPQQFERYSVKQILQRAIGDSVEDHLELSAEVVADVMHLHLQRPLAISLHLMRIDDGLTLQLDVACAITLPCARCAVDVSMELSASSTEEYARLVNEADERYAISNRLTIDLFQQIIDTIGLAIPDVVLCRHNCKGLCHVCGADINLHQNHYTLHPTHKQPAVLANSIKIR